MRFLVLIPFALTTLFLNGQIRTSTSRSVRELVSSDFTVAEIIQFNTGQGIFFQIGNTQAEYMKTVTQYLVKNKNGLYLMPDATGRVYKVEAQDDNYEIVRQDSTYFFGYNFGFYPFTYRDTLYQLGGYGYWKYNGYLRVFVQQRGEWELENLNREIPFSRAAYAAPPIWYNIRKGELWIGFSIDSREGVNKTDRDQKSISDSVYLLNLNKKEWTVVGVLESKLKSLASTRSSHSLGSSPWGNLLYDPTQSTIYLLDFSRNELLKLNRKYTKSIVRILEVESVLYFRDSTLFLSSSGSFSSLKQRPFDSINLSRDKFVSTNSSVYIPVKRRTIADSIRADFVLTLMIGILGGFSIAALFLNFLNRRSKFLKELPNYLGTRGEIRKNLFSEKETELIILVVSNSRKGQGTSIESINTILGVSQKNLEIQKKQRSEIFISINRKWRYASSSQDLLIKKNRLEHDKRSFEYFIDFGNINKVNQLY